LLIANGADVNAKGGYLDGTALHDAAIEGHKEIVELLIGKGANIEAKNSYGETALYCAAEANHKEIVELLIDKGADVNARDTYGKTPLEQAAGWGYDGVVRALITGGADATIRIAIYAGALEKVKSLIESGTDINAREDQTGKTPLHIAALYGQSAIAESLIRKGARVDAPDTEGRTPLYDAIAVGDMPMVELLIKEGADLKIRDARGRSPLHYAAIEGYRDVAEVLISHGAEVNAKDSGTLTPVHLAASNGHVEVAELLIAKGADVQAENSQGKTPLLTAIVRDHWDMVRLLIANGADVNAKTPSGWTPLHCAAREGRLNVAELLLASGATVTVKDQAGITPLHEAARRGFYNGVDLLVEKGADVNAKTNDGQIPLQWARAAGRKEIVELFEADRAGSAAGDVQDERLLQAPAIADQHEVAAKQRTDVETLILGNSAFAFDVYRRLSPSEGNLFFSPHSVSMCLAMAYAGARGNTAKQMAETLHFAMDQENVHQTFAKLQAGLNVLGENAGVKLCVANSLWPQQDYKFLDDYLALARTYYGVSISGVDYAHARKAACDLINKWVEDKTERKITDLIQPESLDDLTLLVLVNAIYFAADWENKFDPALTTDAPFYVSLAESVQAPLMRQTAEVRYTESKSVQVLELPYVAEDLSMLLILPRRIGGIRQLEESLAIENLDGWRHDLKKREVIIFLPRYRITCQFGLDKALQSMGMVDAFIYRKANFAGMDGREDWLYIGAVIHKAFVAVDEQGTEAAAATAVGTYGGFSQPPTFRADHPFLFLIQDNRTGNILFMGRVTDPTRSQ
jgi:serpin B